MMRFAALLFFPLATAALWFMPIALDGWLKFLLGVTGPVIALISNSALAAGNAKFIEGQVSKICSSASLLSDGASIAMQRVITSGVAVTGIFPSAIGALVSLVAGVIGFFSIHSGLSVAILVFCGAGMLFFASRAVRIVMASNLYHLDGKDANEVMKAGEGNENKVLTGLDKVEMNVSCFNYTLIFMSFSFFVSVNFYQIIFNFIYFNIIYFF